MTEKSIHPLDQPRVKKVVVTESKRPIAKRVRKGRGNRKGLYIALAIAGAVLLAIGIVGFAFRNQIRRRLRPPPRKIQVDTSTPRVPIQLR